MSLFHCFLRYIDCEQTETRARRLASVPAPIAWAKRYNRVNPVNKLKEVMYGTAETRINGDVLLERCEEFDALAQQIRSEKRRSFGCYTIRSGCDDANCRRHVRAWRKTK